MYNINFLSDNERFLESISFVFSNYDILMQRTSGIYSNILVPRRKTVAELVKENERRIEKNKKAKEELEKRKSVILNNIKMWRSKFNLFKKKQAQNLTAKEAIQNFFLENNKEFQRIGISQNELSFLIEEEEKKQEINYNKNIISVLNSIMIPRYDLDYTSSNIDSSFLDVVCTNCYEVIKLKNIDDHSLNCVSSYTTNAQHELSFDECNSRMCKLYSSLKSREKSFYKSGDGRVKCFYKVLIGIIFEILENNNSIEEMLESTEKLRLLINSQLSSIPLKERIIFDIFCRRMMQLIYIKTKKMEELMGRRRVSNCGQRVKKFSIERETKRVSEIRSEVENKLSRNEYSIFSTESASSAKRSEEKMEEDYKFIK